jgi:hypothetical protein
MAVLAALAALVAAYAVGAGCSIKNTQQRNEPCLRDFECVQGLVCAPDTSSGDNRLRCTDPVLGTAPFVDGGASGDSGSDAADGSVSE